MLARVAETLYWTARDLERAENLARLLEASQSAALEGNASNGAGGRLVREPLVRVAGDMGTSSSPTGAPTSAACRGS